VVIATKKMHHLVAISKMTVKTRNSVIIYGTVGNNVKAHISSINTRKRGCIAT
jgi:hypothetical protein